MINLVEGTARLECSVGSNDILDLVQIPLQEDEGSRWRSADQKYKQDLVDLGQVVNPVNRIILVVHGMSDSE